MKSAKAVLSFPGICVCILFFTSCSGVKIETDRQFEVAALPDGSVVYLNHHSSIQYEESFDPRQIELEGEAFFNVAPGETPFTVITSSGEVKVKGTEFNVKADANEIAVEVKEGSVELLTEKQQAQLKRGERAVYNTVTKAWHQAKAEYQFSKWTRELEAEFKKLGKELKKSSRQLEKESRKAGKEIKREIKKLNL